jgi:hypothetical protein
MFDLLVPEAAETRLSERHYSLDPVTHGLGYSETLSGEAVLPAESAAPTASRVVHLSVPSRSVGPMNTALARVEQLLALPENWDTYGAVRVQPSIAELGLRIVASLIQSGIPVPAIVPTSSGGLQLEWHTSTVDFELEIRSPFGILYFFQSSDGEASEGPVGRDASIIARYLARLGS